MPKSFSAPRGTNDVLPDETLLWQEVEQKARNLLTIYGYQEIRTPLFEETGLFARSLGQTSEVVQKQMFNVTKGKSLEEDKEDAEGFSLRPEGTASVVRAYLEHHIDKKEGFAKFYYIGPMFRGERPQKGRLRQFHHIGVEAIGGALSPFLDAEIIALSCHLLTELGLKGFQLKMNSLGSRKDKEELAHLLRAQLKEKISFLCEDCQKRFERNVFRILDCKNEQCRQVVNQLPLNDQHLSPESQRYFSQVQKTIQQLKIPFTVVPHLVRGLDYYTHTVFEIAHPSLGSQDAVGAGGRYDHLVEELGGPDVSAVGFALGIERVILARGDEKIPSLPLQVFIVSLGPEAFERAFLLLQEIRHAGISAQMSYEPGSLKSQMRMADKSRAEHVMILGKDELKEKSVTIKNLESGKQEKVSLSNTVAYIKDTHRK